MRATRNHVFGSVRSPRGPIDDEPRGLGFLWKIVREINPSEHGENCAHTTDMVVQRLSGSNPTAVSHDTDNGGSFQEIAARHASRFQWNLALDAIFEIVRSGGHGTIGLVGYLWTAGGAHITGIGNVHGVVAICEGQNSRGSQQCEAISDIRRATIRYAPPAGATYGYAPVRWGTQTRVGWEGGQGNPLYVLPRSDRMSQ